MYFDTQDGILGTNMYAYCQNEPVNFGDPSGAIPVETVLDVAGLAWSAVDFYNNPSLLNAGFLLWDVAAIVVPYAPGSYVGKGAKLGVKALSKADDVFDVYKAASKADNVASAASKAWKTAGKTISKIDNIKLAKHINVPKHLWGKVMDEVTHEGIEKVIQKAIKNGSWITQNSANNVFYIFYKYKGNIIEVRGRIIDGVFKVSDAFVQIR